MRPLVSSEQLRQLRRDLADDLMEAHRNYAKELKHIYEDYRDKLRDASCPQLTAQGKSIRADISQYKSGRGSE